MEWLAMNDVNSITSCKNENHTHVEIVKWK